jgi:hypothetical protein
MLHYIRAHRVQLGRPPGPIPPPIFCHPSVFRAHCYQGDHLDPLRAVRCVY